MRHKVNAKQPGCQDRPETPEQKEIRLLKKRLAKATSEWQWYMSHWHSAKAELREAEKKLHYAGKLVEMVDKEGLYKILAEDLQHQNKTLLSMYKKSQQEVEEWKRKCEALQVSSSRKRSQVTQSSSVVHLICIKSGPLDVRYADGTIHTYAGDELDYLSRYTSRGLITDENGVRVYPVKELRGDRYPAEYFHVSTASPL